MIHLANTSAHLSAVVGPVGLEIQACRAPNRLSIAFATEDLLGVEVPKIGRCVLAIDLLTQRRSVCVCKYSVVSVSLLGNFIRLLTGLFASDVVFPKPPPRCPLDFSIGAPSHASGHVTGISGDGVKEPKV